MSPPPRPDAKTRQPGQAPAQKQSAAPDGVLQVPQGGGQFQSLGLGSPGGMSLPPAPDAMPVVFDDIGGLPCSADAINDRLAELQQQKVDAQQKLDALEEDFNEVKEVKEVLEDALEAAKGSSQIDPAQKQAMEGHQDILEEYGFDEVTSASDLEQALKTIKKDLNDQQEKGALADARKEARNLDEAQQRLLDAQTEVESIEGSIDAIQEQLDANAQSVQATAQALIDGTAPDPTAYDDFQPPFPSPDDAPGAPAPGIMDERVRVQLEKTKLALRSLLTQERELALQARAQLLSQRQHQEGAKVSALEKIQADLPCDVETQAARDQLERTQREIDEVAAALEDVPGMRETVDQLNALLDAKAQSLDDAQARFDAFAQRQRNITNMLRQMGKTVSSDDLDLIEGAKDFTEGFFNQAGDAIVGLGVMAKGVGSFTWNVVTLDFDEAGQQLEALEQIVEQIVEDPTILVKPIIDDFKAGKYASAFGRVLFEGITLIGPAALTKSGKAGKTAKTVNALEEGADAAGDTSKAAGATNKASDASDAAKTSADGSGGAKDGGGGKDNGGGGGGDRSSGGGKPKREKDPRKTPEEIELEKIEEELAGNPSGKRKKELRERRKKLKEDMKNKDDGALQEVEPTEKEGRKATDSSKNEKHGDSGRALEAAEKRIQELEKELREGNLSRRDKQKLKNRIQKIRKDAQKKKRGEEHGRKAKR